MTTFFIGTVVFFDMLFIAFRTFLLHIYSTGPGFQLNTSFEMLALLLVLNPWKIFAKCSPENCGRTFLIIGFILT